MSERLRTASRGTLRELLLKKKLDLSHLHSIEEGYELMFLVIIIMSLSMWAMS